MKIHTLGRDEPARTIVRPAFISAFVFVVALAVVFALHAFLKRPEAPDGDALRYLSLAWSLEQHGVFAEAGPRVAAPRPGMRFMPLYPALLAIALRFDDELRDNVECALSHPYARAVALCKPVFTTVVSAQLVLYAVALWLIWHLAFDLSASKSAAWASLAAASLSRLPFEFANMFLLEILLITLFALLSLAIVRSVRTGGARWVGAVGATFGLLTLVKAVFLYVAIGFGLSLALLALAKGFRRRSGLRRSWLLAPLAFVVVLSPWLARNALVLGQPGLSSGYGGHILVQRVAYNDMTPAEWGAAFVFWFPDVGDSIARRVFERQHYERLRTVGERSFYVAGNTTLNADTKASARNRGQSHSIHLFLEHIVGNLGKHLAVTIPMAWQGLFVAKWWGVIAIVCLLARLRRMVRAPRVDVVLVALVPVLALSLHALVSVSFPRYNLPPLLPLLSVCIGLTVARFADLIAARMARGSSAH